MSLAHNNQPTKQRCKGIKQSIQIAVRIGGLLDCSHFRKKLDPRPPTACRGKAFGMQRGCFSGRRVGAEYVNPIIPPQMRLIWRPTFQSNYSLHPQYRPSRVFHAAHCISQSLVLALQNPSIGDLHSGAHESVFKELQAQKRQTKRINLQLKVWCRTVLL